MTRRVARRLTGQPATDGAGVRMTLEALGYGCRDNGLTLGLNGQIRAVQEPLRKEAPA